ncbi:hypothetical protein Tco_0606902 [Tanacetum coccineum]
MNEQAADKEKEQKAESVHEEDKEVEGAKKRKLGTRRKQKAKRRKVIPHWSHKKEDDLKICIHIAPEEDKVIDVRFLITISHLSNGNKRFFRTLMGVLSIFDREDLKAVYELVMEEYQDENSEGFDKMLLWRSDNNFLNDEEVWGTYNHDKYGQSIHILDRKIYYPSDKEGAFTTVEILSLETEEEALGIGA